MAGQIYSKFFENAHKKTLVKIWIFENFVKVASKILIFCSAILF